MTWDSESWQSCVCGDAAEGGVPIEAPFAHVVTFRGEQIARWHAYEHRDEAPEAVGLRE